MWFVVCGLFLFNTAAVLMVHMLSVIIFNINMHVQHLRAILRDMRLACLIADLLVSESTMSGKFFSTDLQLY